MINTGLGKDGEESNPQHTDTANFRGTLLKESKIKNV